MNGLVTKAKIILERLPRIKLKPRYTILTSAPKVPAPSPMPAPPEAVKDEPTSEIPGHASLFKTLKDCADLLTELEDMHDKLDERARPLSEHIRVTLQEMVERAGAIRIEDEPSFDVSRHQSVPVARVSPGTPIAETVEPGYVFDGRVIKRAKVVIVR